MLSRDSGRVGMSTNKLNTRMSSRGNGPASALVLRRRLRLAAESLQVAPAAELNLQLWGNNQRRPHVRLPMRPARGLRGLWYGECQWAVTGCGERRAVRAGGGVDAVAVVRGGLSELSRTRGPDGREEDAEDGDVAVHDDDGRSFEVVAVAEDEDELRDVEDDGEHEVGEGDPEECPEARAVRSYGLVSGR